MSAAGNCELIERFYRAFQQRDAATMAACYAPHATFRDPVFTLAGAQVGTMWRMLCARGADLHVVDPVTLKLTLKAKNAVFPQTVALMPFIDGPFGITQPRLQAILEGMEMDLRQNRYLDFPALRRYAHLVAGVVGEISAGVFGYTDPRTVEYADRLGLALQLINVIRDVGDDARRGRIYIPVDELQRFDVRAADLLNGRYVDGFVPLMRFQCARARATYDEALALLPRADRPAQRPGLIMGAIYATLLDEIEHENFQVLHQRIALTPLRKLWIAWRTWVRG